jgi:hypothetical protein
LANFSISVVGQMRAFGAKPLRWAQHSSSRLTPKLYHNRLVAPKYDAMRLAAVCLSLVRAVLVKFRCSVVRNGHFLALNLTYNRLGHGKSTREFRLASASAPLPRFLCSTHPRLSVLNLSSKEG